MKRNKMKLYLSMLLLMAFVVWTVLVLFVDVSSIGPNNSKVGLSTLNGVVHNLIGTNLALYNITDWLGLVPIITSLIFAVFGLIQLIKRKSIIKVDWNIITLGLFYIVVFIIYVMFEYIVINYRPVLINGYLETSYPSSTTMLVITVMITTIMQINSRVKNKIIKISINTIISLFIVFMLIGRIISGVHWFSDIVGGALISTGLVILYDVLSFENNNLRRKYEQLRINKCKKSID